MLFKKSFTDIDFQDIQKLYEDKIEESEILDYKEREIDDDNVLKEVAAFSNTRGGFLIYGIKESGRGGYPEKITGIESKFNSERLEQIIISNIMPRISVRIKKINIPDSDNIVVLINIPEGQHRPYYTNKKGKFYKRYNFEAKEMDEHEIEALYLERFFGVGNLSKYVDETISFNRSLISNVKEGLMDAHIIITPLRIDKKIEDASNLQQINLNPNDIRLEPDEGGLYLPTFSSPSKYGIRWAKDDINVEIHRNGLIHYMRSYGYLVDDKKIQDDYYLTINLLQTLRFASLVYSRLGFAGRVKIIIKINDCKDSIITLTSFPHRDSKKCLAEHIFIEREWDSWKLEDDCSTIGKSILDEFSNHYGLWLSRFLVEEDGEIKLNRI